ncbi:MAG TPA: hypothetical protein VMP11_15680 [Verrucomicrobiae bacterium]|nr:hypothetical protein [Verrucomicrobiae bacterium]
MKKCSWTVFCMAASVAGLIGQVAAFGASTNATYTVTVDYAFAAAKESTSSSATAAFLSDNSFSVVIGTDNITGTYTVKGSQVTLTPDADGTAALESNVFDWIETFVPPEVVITFKTPKPAKLKLDKTGVPESLKGTVSGKGTEGKKSRSFSIKTSWTDWTLTSGTNF